MDGRGGWFGGLRPGAVAGSFEVPLDVLAFDESRVGSSAADRVETSQESGDDIAP